MQQRIDYAKVAPEAFRMMVGFERYLGTTELELPLRELVKIRASQLNGCAYCLDMHTKDAVAIGEDLQRIFCVGVWRESPFYTERERVALELTEAVTQIGDGGVPDDLYARVREHFSEKATVDLIVLINTINSWNRLAISMQAVPGAYVSPHGK